LFIFSGTVLRTQQQEKITTGCLEEAGVEVEEEEAGVEVEEEEAGVEVEEEEAGVEEMNKEDLCGFKDEVDHDE
jgi:hypothetical protein